MRRSNLKQVLSVMVLVFVMGACGMMSETTPPEEWNDRYIFAYNEEEDAHYGCTIIVDGEEYGATFEDFLCCKLFNQGAKVSWADLGDETWELIARKGSQTHRFQFQKAVTPMGVEGVDIVFWSYNDMALEGFQRTANFHRLMDSKEWHQYQSQ